MKGIFYFTIPLLVARIYTCVLVFGTSGNAALHVVLPLLRGFFSDLAVGLVFGLVVHGLHRRRILFFSVWLVWVLLVSLNAEFIAVRASNMNYRFLHLALAEDFLLGSTVSIKNLINFLVCSLGSLPLLFAAGRLRFARSISLRRLATLAAVSLLVVLVPPSRSHPSWLQANFAEENARTLFTGSTVHLEKEEVPPEVRKKFLIRDLDGEPVTKYPEDRPNVLLVLVESISYEASLSDPMPFFRSLHEEGRSYPGFITLQHQTNKGMYAVLCGDFPNFLTNDSKSDLMAASRYRRTCLPEALRQNSYHTVFMQSANLRYMSKDRFATEAGFEGVFGNADYQAAFSRTNWGVDDATLYRHAIDKLKKLGTSEKPWFVTLLTAGTHHPYNVPGNANPTYDEAVSYADESLRRFVSALRKEGLLENTVAIFTADEPHRTSKEGLAGMMEYQHIPLVVLIPGMEGPSEHSGHYTQADLFLSITDYLSIPHGNATGRSIFRRYKEGRNLFFGDIYASRVYSITQDNTLYVCSTSLAMDLECSAYEIESGSLFGSDLPLKDVDEAYVHDLRRMLAANELTAEKLASHTVFRERNETYRGSSWVMGDHRMSARKGDTITWRLKIRAHDYIQVSFHARTVLPETEQIFIKEFAVKGGDSYTFSHEFTAPSDITSLWSNLSVLGSRNGTYIIEDLVIERRRRTEGS
jgi:phosphoglycerol transferase MdoB-like AlkP superfamily enzyme